MTDDPVRDAEFEVDQARAKMIATSQEILRQLQPHRLMEEAWETAKEKGADLAENAVDAVSRRPVAAGAVVAGIVAFLAREPLMDLAGKLASGVKNKRADRKRRKTPAKNSETEAAE
jgi:hypothetical protein